MNPGKKVLRLIFIGVSLFLIVFFLFLPNYTRIKELSEEKERLIKRIKETEQQIIKIKEELKSLKKSPFYLEKLARERLGTVRKNEVVIKIEEQNQELNKPEP